MAPAVCAIPSIDQHARHDRRAGEMAREMRLVEGDVLDADGRLVAVDIDDPVDQQERIAMRQQLPASRLMSSVSSVDRLLQPSAASPLSLALARGLRAASTLAERAPSHRMRRRAAPARAGGTSSMHARRGGDLGTVADLDVVGQPTLPPSTTKSPSVAEPEMPHMRGDDAMPADARRCGRSGRGCRSWCPRRSTVSRLAPRSMVVLAPISTSSWMMTRPICGTFSVPRRRR